MHDTNTPIPQTMHSPQLIWSTSDTYWTVAFCHLPSPCEERTACSMGSHALNQLNFPAIQFIEPAMQCTPRTANLILLSHTCEPSNKSQAGIIRVSSQYLLSEVQSAKTLHASEQPIIYYLTSDGASQSAPAVHTTAAVRQ